MYDFVVVLILKCTSLNQVVLTEEQIAALDQACEASDAAIGEEYKCLVRETAQKVGVTGATVRDYFSKKKRLVGPELVCCLLQIEGVCVIRLSLHWWSHAGGAVGMQYG